MNIKPIKITYVSSSDMTYIDYMEIVRNKETERCLILNGRLPCNNNEYEVTKLIEEELNKQND